MQKTLDFIWEMLVQEDGFMKETAEAKKLRRKLSELSEMLRKNLSDEKNAALNAYLDCLFELNSLSEFKSFVTGVRFATVYMLEALYAD